MNKNKLVNLIFIIVTILFNIIFLLNNFLKFTSLDYIMAIFLFLISLYLFAKFIAYYSDSSIFLGTTFLFSSFFIFLSRFYNLNILATLNFIYLSILIGFLMLFIYFKSSQCLSIFINGLLLFFPILFYIFNIITLNNFFIFILICVIIILLFSIIFNAKKERL